MSEWKEQADKYSQAQKLVEWCRGRQCLAGDSDWDAFQEVLDIIDRRLGRLYRLMQKEAGE